MEDELEEDFEEERSLNTDDFDEHADDMEDLEDLTPEEAEDREAILETSRCGTSAAPASSALAGSRRRVSDVSSHVDSHSNSSQLLLVVPSASSEICSIY